MLKSSLCAYRDAYVLFKKLKQCQEAPNQSANNNGVEAALKNYAPVTDCKINNTQINNAKDIDVVMSIYNLIEYSDNYSKTFGSLQQYYRDEPSSNDNYVNNTFPGNSTLFKFKQERTGETGDCDTNDVEAKALLKYSSNFWRTLTTLC